MRYLSTRDASLSLSAAEAIARGLSREGGLFLPESLPRVGPEEIRALGSTQVHIVASSGAMKNIEALSRNNAKLAFIQSDVGFYASRGTRLFSQKYDKFSTVAVLYPEPVQIVTLTPEIERV